jgi:hypothetical protein
MITVPQALFICTVCGFLHTIVSVRARAWYWTFGALFSVVLLAVAVSSLVTEFQRHREDQLRTVERQIRELATLTTTRFDYRDVVYFRRQTRVLGLPAGDQETLFSVEIAVIAGVDLTRELSVETHGPSDRILVTLAAPEILRVDTDEASLRQYLFRERFGRIDWLDLADELAQAKERNRDDAVERGILDQAERQAQSIVRSLLYSAGFDSVDVRFAAHRELQG